MVDNIEITGYDLDGAEADAGWTFDGFRVTNGTEIAFYSHYYVAEFRQYRGYDKALNSDRTTSVSLITHCSATGSSTSPTRMAC